MNAKEMKEQCIAAVEAEPELPGTMPLEMEHKFRDAMARNDLDFIIAALRHTIRLTKQEIVKRIEEIE